MIFLIVCIGIVSYYLWIWSYWIRRGVNGPRGLPFSGVLHLFQNADYPAVFHFRDWTKKHGSIYGITEGVQKTLVVSNPEFVHEVFVKQFDNFYGRNLNPIQGDPEKDKTIHMFLSQGHRWKRLRSLSSPAFSSKNLGKIMKTAEESIMELMRHLEKRHGDELRVDVLELYQQYTLDVICKQALGQTTTSMFENPLMAKMKEIMAADRLTFFFISGMFPLVGKMLRKLFTKFPSLNPLFGTMSTLRNVVEERMKQRLTDENSWIEGSQEQRDFIDMFLDTRADDEFFENEVNDDFRRVSRVDKKLTLDEIVGQLMLFLLAGYDTTALSLAYSTYLLATHPEVQKKVQEEVDKECPDPEVTFEQLAKLKYMENVIKEALRLYPMASIFHSRKCMNSTEICGMEIEKGTNIQVDTWSLHHDSCVWGEDVEEFKPERWLTPETDAIVQKGGYLPFGMGLRICIAVRLAYMEIKICLVHLLRKYSFETTLETVIPLKLGGRTTIGPKGVMLNLKERNSS